MSLISSLSSVLALLCATPSVHAARLHAGGVDFSAAVAAMKDVDRYHDGDRYVVFETEGKTMVEVANPEPTSCSLETFKTVLQGCGTRGKICIGVYKFSYPMKIGSSTRKEKSVLVRAQDPAAMGQALGGGFKVMQVQMPTINFVWKPLEAALSSGAFSPAAKLELSDEAEIAGLSGSSVWEQIARAATRIGEDERESFLQHAENQIAKAASDASATADVPLTSSNADAGEPGTQINAVVPPVAPPTIAQSVDTKQIAKEVEDIVAKKVEDIARRAAQDEIGRALRKFSTDMSHTISEVAKVWMDKAKA